MPINESGQLPALSVILPTPDSFETIRKTVSFLRRQTVSAQLELVIVCPSKELLDLDQKEVSDFMQLNIVEIGSILTVASAYAAGVRAAASHLVVLSEDHCYPDPKWAQALIAAHEKPYAAVGPVVRNANPCNNTSWADFLIAYSPWMQPSRSGTMDFLPGHNSSYKREILLGYGDRLTQMMEAECLLHWDLRSKGFQLYLESEASSAHTNFALTDVWLNVQFHVGRMFGAERARPWSPLKRSLYTLGSPLIVVVRYVRIMQQLRRRGASGLLANASPMLLLGLAVDAFGQMIGYAFGVGNSLQVLAGFEFHRDRYSGISDAPISKPQSPKLPTLH